MATPPTEVVSGHIMVRKTPKDGIDSLISLANIHFCVALPRTCLCRWPLPAHGSPAVDVSGGPRTAVAWYFTSCAARAPSARLNGWSWT